MVDPEPGWPKEYKTYEAGFQGIVAQTDGLPEEVVVQFCGKGEWSSFNLPPRWWKLSGRQATIADGKIAWLDDLPD